ncbi:MAG: DNA-binding NarL/FixJ family response regulator [Bacteroidia bacterium]
MKQIIKIALVDDHKVMRSALANYLKGVPGFKVLFDVGTLSDMQSRLNWDDKPDVLLMDYSMKNEKGPDGIIYIRETLGDEMSILGLSMHQDPRIVNEVIESGANGYLFKGIDIDEMEHAIRSVHLNGFYINEFTKSMVNGEYYTKRHQNAADMLTSTEKSIIVGICKEESSEDIGAKLNLTLNTIKTYRKKILRKIGAKNTAGVVVYAIRHDIYIIQ